MKRRKRRRRRKRSKPKEKIHIEDPPSKKRKKTNDDDEWVFQKYSHVSSCLSRLQNIVVVLSTGTSANHALIYQILENYEFFKHKFAAAAIRVIMPNGDKRTVLVYTTGMLIVVGAKSNTEAKFISKFAVHEIGKIKKKKFIRNQDRNRRYFYDDIQHESKSGSIKCGKIETANTVYKCILDREKICLNEIRNTNQEIARYAPESFPGVIIKGKNATFLVFESGCCLMLGLSNTNNLDQDLENAYQELLGYVNNSSRKKKSMNIISRHIWELNNNREYEMASTSREKLRKYVDERRRAKTSKVVTSKKRKIKSEIKSLVLRRKIKSKFGSVGGFSKVNKVKKGGRKTKADNFRNRLVELDSFGKFIPMRERICDDGVISDDVRNTVDIDDFHPRVDRVLSQYNKAQQ